MSRIGKLPIELLKGVTFNHNNDVVTVKGPKGTLTQDIEPGFEFVTEGNSVTLKRPTDQKRHKALHGLYRNLVFNMVKGVTDGYEIVLEMVGVGYRAEAKGQLVDLSLGFSHQVVFLLPDEIAVATEAVKGQNPKIILKSIDKQLIGQVAAKIRSIRPPEPYKGKGVRKSTETIRRKAGKAAGKGKK